MKIFTALMLARYFDSNDRAYLDFRSFLIAMGIIGLPVGLIIIQPDFGTAASFFPLDRRGDVLRRHPRRGSGRR